ncbi:MAG: TetR/AcrR family transcriptional regulator [Treponema sp.]|nr:TetR/AcrR family transcriptional regulator [Treponema sp.]
MTRIEQREKRRQEILITALDIFIHKGYAAAKTQDIANAAGMSEGLLFHYFETKEKLYEELVKTAMEGREMALTGVKNEGLEYFQKTAKMIFHYLKTEPFVAKMFVLAGQAQNNEAAPESVKTLIAKLDFEPTIKKIKQGQKKGHIKKGDPAALAFAFWGAIQGIAEQIALLPDIPVPDSEWIVDIIRK